MLITTSLFAIVPFVTWVKVELLSGPNRCSLEACAPLLAASGPSYVEALLCLYRGRGLHEDALTLATEER